EGRDDSLQWAAMREQRHHCYDQLGRGTQPVEDRPFRDGKGLVTLRTHEPLVLTRVDTDIPLAALSSSRAVHIGAEYSCGVHDGPPGVVEEHAKKSMSGPPFLLQAAWPTFWWGAPAAANTIRARRASCWGVPWRRTRDSSPWRSVSKSAMAGGL